MALDLLALHMLGDYVLQNEWMAQNKLSDPLARLLHVLVYSIPFLLWGNWYYDMDGLLFGLALGAVHFAVDSHRFAANHPWPPKSILIDQSLHIISLAVLVRLFLG